MVAIVEAEAADVVAVLGGDGREQAGDGEDVGGDGAGEDGAVDGVSGDGDAGVEGVEADVAGGVDELAEVDTVVFARDEADGVGWGGHGCGGIGGWVEGGYEVR